MKLFNKYFLLAVASCCLFTACSDDDDYTPGSPAIQAETMFTSLPKMKRPLHWELMSRSLL